MAYQYILLWLFINYRVPTVSMPVYCFVYSKMQIVWVYIFQNVPLKTNISLCILCCEIHLHLFFTVLQLE